MNNGKNGLSAERTTIYTAVATVISVIFVYKVFGITDSAIIVSLLIIPLLTYGILSGRLRELSGPGGWGAKFSEAAAKRLSPTKAALSLTRLEMDVIPKESLARLDERIGKIRDGRPIVLTMTLGSPSIQYDPLAVSKVIDALSNFRGFKFIVITDTHDHLIAYFPHWSLKELLKAVPAAGEENIINMINDSLEFEIANHPLAITDVISDNSSNVDALEKMEELNLEAIIVVNGTGKFKGVVERDRILSKMMIALAKEKMPEK